MTYDADKIRQLNSLNDQLTKYGIEVDRKGFTRCPFHNEKTASFRVYPDNSFYCFGCGAHGDVIGFVMKIENIGFQEACERLDGDLSYSEQRRLVHKKREREKKLNAAVDIARAYWKAFDNWRINENIIKAFEPKGPDAAPCSAFLRALGNRSHYEHELDCAEILYLKGAESIG